MLDNQSEQHRALQLLNSEKTVCLSCRCFLRNRPMQICIHPLLYLYFFTMAILTSWETTAGAAAALIVHELGHWMACCLTGDSIDSLELTPFGGIMTYAQGKAPSKGIRGIVIAAAGPAANYLILLIVSTFSEVLEYDLQKAIVSSNAAMLCINLLPVLPLDGGRILFCLGYYVFPVVRLIAILSGMGIAAGIGFLLLSVYGAIELGYLNCSVTIVGFYLAYCSWKCRTQMMTENLYAILQERMDDVQPLRRIRRYRVSENTRLINLVSLLGNSFECEFVYADNRIERRISEDMLCKKLLEAPMQSIGEAFL